MPANAHRYNIYITYWRIRPFANCTSWQTFKRISESNRGRKPGCAYSFGLGQDNFTSFETAKRRITEICLERHKVYNRDSLGLLISGVPSFTWQKDWHTQEIWCTPCAVRLERDGLADVAYRFSKDGETIDLFSIEETKFC